MKKRKELNALIGLGDSKRKKTKKGTGHRLLRTEPPDSESESSSDDDEFNGMSSGAHVGKRSYTQCCNVCYPLFLFIILAACVTACAGLIWMQIALKEDLDTLKAKLHSMESSQKVSSSEIPKLSEDLKNKDKKLDDFENGDKGLSKLWSNLTEMNRKISLLDSAVNHLKANLKSAADLVSLPTTVEELEKSVAKIGSTLTSVQHDVKTIQDVLENRNKDEELKKTMDIADLRMAVSEANQTEELRHARTDEHVHGLLSAVADLQQRVSSLENGSQPTSKKPSERPATEAVKEAAATTNPTPGGAPDVSTPLTEPQTEPQTSRQPRFATPNRSKRNAEASCPEKLILSRVNSLKDLEDIFQQKGVGRDSVGFDFRSLRKVFRTSTPDARTLECFDSDGNQRYSLAELRAAAGL